MTDLIIIRLHPADPESAGQFTTDLTGLSVAAYDLSVTDETGGTLLGTAAGLADPHTGSPGDDTVDITTAGIMQHYADWSEASIPLRGLQAAATAVIIANPPAGYPEYPTQYSYDLRFEITRGGQAVADAVIDYNVLTVQVSGALPSDQTWYFAQGASTYIPIPPAPPAGAPVPALTLDPDGTAPPFDALRAAIDDVLAKDPGGGDGLAGYGLTAGTLTAARCRQIAAEIVWNRYVAPQPAEPGDYGSLYSNPEPEPSVNQQDADTARQKFEGDMSAYYATNNALVTRLTDYVYAAWAAVICEQSSSRATSAAFPFPVITGQPGTPIDTAVVLTWTTPGTPQFAVPAAYFYAMATTLPAQVAPAQRYDLARYNPEAKTQLDLTTAQAANVVAATEGFVTLPTLAAIDAAQAARRLAGLGAVTGSLPTVSVVPAIEQIIDDWLAYGGDSADVDTAFWPGEVAANQAGYLHLVLQVVAGDYPQFDQLLGALAAAPLGVGTVAQLAAVTDQQWRAFFLPAAPAVPDLGLLPPFTQPGTPTERVEAFIRHLQAFFTVPTALVAPVTQAPGTPGTLGTPVGDLLARFAAGYAAEGGGTFTFGSAWDQSALTAAVADTLPGDPAAQAWLTQALNTVEALYTLTAAAPGELRFSLMEALYARGFTGDAAIRRLTPDQFQAALTGTVAYPYAAAIQSAAGGSSATAPAAGGPFQPVNPDGSLTDCVPPAWLSPFGPVAYLADLLQAGAASTCEQPGDPTAAEQFATLLTGRRGPLGDLHATAADLETPLPVIDLVNESLEALAAAVAPGGSGAIGGAVFDTAGRQLAGHPLRDAAQTGSAATRGHDPAALFAALPEHSSPATVDVPAAGAAAYAALRTDFSAPALPYDQPLDIDRSYLRRLCTTRYAAMRRFRKDITEFVLDPAAADEPTGFQRHVWRYPVRLELALEYLCISAQEYQYLFTQVPATKVQDPDPDGGGGPTLWGLYGYPEPQTGDTSWTRTVLVVSEFLRRTGIGYCDLVELQRRGPVPFTVLRGEAVLRNPTDPVTDQPPTDPAQPTDPTGPARPTQPADPVGALPPAGSVDVSPTAPTAPAPPTPVGTVGQPIGVGVGSPETGLLPECEPCCLEEWRIVFGDQDQDQAVGVIASLYELIVFIRLWRKLGEAACQGLTIGQLADIAAVLGLFVGGAANPDFPRQLAALLMLRDDFGLPLGAPGSVPGAVSATPSERIPLLALWTTPTPDTWGRAVRTLLGGVRRHAASRFAERRGPEYDKIVAEDLDRLSALAGFDPATATDTWHAQPTHTLRFAEVLAKVYASDFSVGDLVFLFTTDAHLDGEDPFPLADPDETADDPLALPEADPADGDGAHSLWALRRALLDLEPGDGDAEHWSWARITATLRDEYGYTPDGSTDPLAYLGAHFFPDVLEAEGQPVAGSDRRFGTALAAADTSPLMWTAQRGPFGYDPAAGQLTVRLPLRDGDLIHRLGELRALHPAEQSAVRELYFAPRAALAPFAAFFKDFGAAVDFLVQEPDERTRFAFFQRQFDLFHRRCRAIAEHLAAHVDAVVGRRGDRERDAGRGRPGVGFEAAWLVLRTLLADGNLALGPWESDSGQPPAPTWGPRPSGGAFAALLGLRGTGLLGEYRTAAGDLVWRETRGPLTAFGRERDALNAPVPTVLPALDAAIAPDQARFAAVRNGFALRERDGEPLGGAQPFRVRWTGVLLVEHRGEYRFHAGPPLDPGGEPWHETFAEARAACADRWRVTLRRGQRTWTLLDDADPDGPGAEVSEPITLRRGAYEITAEFEQNAAAYDGYEDVRPTRTGFELRYRGPDTGGRLTPIEADRLYRGAAQHTLGTGIVATRAKTDQGAAQPISAGQSAAEFLDGQYTGSLRDIRRTYQRAFKALLFAELFRLGARPVPGYRQSELGFLYAHPASFAGTAYPRTGPGAFGTHHAWFDPDLLPVGDPYPPQPLAPNPVTDERAAPSPQRRAALFDSWERVFDACLLRAETDRARERPAWLLYAEAAEEQPDEPAELLRHLGVDLRHTPLMLTYFDTPGYTLAPDDLTDERWAVRAWHGEVWLRRLIEHFTPVAIGTARPDLWAADDPGAPVGTPPLSGNANLTAFVQDGYLENGRPHRYEQLRELNDGLRERARCALLAYLCAVDRVDLPWGGTAATARDLSDLLLQDVEAGIGQRMSRIEDAARAAQAFVQRARLGLEAPAFTASAAFAQVWDKRFATFRTWEACRRREVYRENWIAWDDLHAARRFETFRHLEDDLRRSTLAIAAPGGVTWWPNADLPPHPGLVLAQDREPVEDGFLQPAIEGLGLSGTPQRAARPSWLAPVTGTTADSGGNGNPTEPGGELSPQQPAAAAPAAKRRTRKQTAALEGGASPVVGAVLAPADAAPAPTDPTAPIAPAGTDTALPLWLLAAVRLGANFVRVAAAGVPPASAHFTPHHADGACCADCAGGAAQPVDEYYFWLEGSSYFLDTDAPQDADAGLQATSAGSAPTDETSSWEQPALVPGLLAWNPRPMVHLHWSRVQHGEFEPPRRSSEGLPIDPATLGPGAVPTLSFLGRTADSLRFEVAGGQAPVGYTDPTPPGFRYDLAADTAVPLPLVSPPATSTPPAFVGDLPAYPFFVYLDPGAPIEPLSPFSVALAVAGTLRAHCKHEAALKWYELAYTPLAADNTWALCASAWQRDGDTTAAATNEPPPTGAPGPTPVEKTTAPDVACCPSAPVDLPRARDRAVLLAYLETMSQWAQSLLRRNSPETAQQAEVVLGAVARILGARPLEVAARGDQGPAMTVADFDPRPAPLNPRLLALYDRTAERLALIRHDQDGRRLRAARHHDGQAFWGGSRLRDGWREAPEACEGEPCGDGLCQDEADELCCSGPYRFTFLIQKAMELASEVRSLGAALLSAYEKNDAEALAALRSAHERQLADLALASRQYAWRESDWQVQALSTSKQGAQARLRYYQQLLQNGLNAGETGYEALTGAAIASRTASTVTEAIGQAMTVVPDITVGVAGMGPLEANQLPVGSKLAGNFATAARILNVVADIAGTSAGLSLTEGGWDRRTQEWQLQVTTITIEIEQIEQQILAAERRRDAALRDLNDHQQSIEHAVEVEDFLRGKFTNSELYLYLVQETAGLHRRMYDLARHAARRAERAYNYERGHTARRFLPDPGWEDLHEGLTAGDRLHLALRQMENAYLDLNCREYELTKHFSLRQDFPLAYLRLRETGRAEIEIPEWMFDLDYPGQYLRRIKNVTMTIPCVVGPYTGVHCRLTLLGSTTRVDPRLSGPRARCCGQDGPQVDHYGCKPVCGDCDRAGCGGCAGDCGAGCASGSCDNADGYLPGPDDPRFVRGYAATEAIATSSGQNDSGLFELSFRDERYLPFEFAGAVSRWRIELPPETNRFDFESLSDVVLHLNHTAREGGEPLRAAAGAAARRHLPGAGLRLFDVRHDLPDAWTRLRAGAGPDDPAVLPLRLARGHFPFLPGHCDLRITSVTLVVEVAGSVCRDRLHTRFLSGHERPHGPGEPCGCRGRDVECLADADTPGLYYGVLDLPLGPLGRGPGDDLGEFRLDAPGREITKVFVLCTYDTSAG